MTKWFVIFAALLACSPAWSATCKVSEYASLATDSGGNEIPVAEEPALRTQTVTYTTSAQSAAFSVNTRFVRVICDAKAHFVISTAGTNATANDPYVAADTPEYFGLRGLTGLVIDFYDGTS